MRIILFTGKGGVGKTTMAAATALKGAEEGARTLIISTDPAHSLSDALDVDLGPEPIKVKDNLWAQELDVYYSMQKYWGNLRELMLTVFRWQGVKDVMAEEMSAIPGMEEGAAFMWIEKYYSENTYDLIVIDSAPTGETLTLLTLPQVTKWWVTKAFPMQKFAIKTVGKVVRGATGIPLDKGYDELNHLFVKLERIHKVFADPDICSIRIVTNPERMVINESKRAYTYLQLYGYNVDGVIINRIWPEAVVPSTFEKYVESQKKYIEDIRTSFSPVPIFEATHLGEEVFGLDLLRKLGERLYGEHRADAIFFKEKPYTVKETSEGFQLMVRLPFVQGKKFTLNKYGDELVIDVGNKRQNLFLPRFAHFMKLDSHSYEEGVLTVVLKKQERNK